MVEHVPSMLSVYVHSFFGDLLESFDCLDKVYIIHLLLLTIFCFVIKLCTVIFQLAFQVEGLDAIYLLSDGKPVSTKLFQNVPYPVCIALVISFLE